MMAKKTKNKPYQEAPPRKGTWRKTFTIDELKEQWHEKESFLQQYCESVTPYNFYRDIFPEGSFERKGHYDDRKPNGIILILHDDTHRTRKTVTDDLDNLIYGLENEFVITSPVSYFGKNRSAKNARWIYGITIDLDGVTVPQLQDLLYQMSIGHIPQTTYIVNSGTGMHLYYVLQEPIPAYPFNRSWLKALKKALIERIWNYYTSLSDSPQIQGIVQGYRVVGSASKFGPEYPVTAYCTGGKHLTVDDLLNCFKKDDMPLYDNLKNLMIKKETISLEQAKEKWPEWAEHLNEDKPRQKWVCNEKLYTWWLNKIPKEAMYGHRYFCIMTLAIYAAKCNIDEDRLYNDAFSLLDVLEAKTIQDDNHFTREDIVCALEAYNDDYVTFPRKSIENMTAITIPPAKRNGRKQEDHLKIARFAENLKYPDYSWQKGNGRPTAQNDVLNWRKENPNGTKKNCKDETGLSYPTIRKWWDSEQKQ